MLWRRHLPDDDFSLTHLSDSTGLVPVVPVVLRAFQLPPCLQITVCESWLIIYLLSDLAEKVPGHSLPLLDELL